MLTLQQSVELLGQYVGANKEPKIQINLVCEYYLKCSDPIGSLERVTFVVTADSNGEGFITLPSRYDTIRGAVEHPTTSPQSYLCGLALNVRDDYYEFVPGNLGMIKGDDPMRGIIPIGLSQSGLSPTTDPSDGNLLPRKYKVPVCPTSGDQSFFTVICKRAFTFLSDDNAILPIQNLSALTYGLKALDKRDAEDYAREKELWEMGKTCLAEEKENQTGPEALGKVQVEDDFGLGSIGQEVRWSGWGGGGWGIYGWD